ncbi:hypothetical protein BGZ67_006381 [Mortierella alpina]|nr:hypothetical protein BGZ67_006381 [Mortierella alpina]
MAVKLQSQGERVPLLAVMDTPAEISVEEEEAESDVPDKPTKYDEYLARLVGDSPTDGALALKRMVAPVLVNIIKLSKNFTSSVYSGDILFFRATVREKANMRLIDPACWGPYIRGNIEVHDVDCAHVEMDKSEHIAVVGRTVAAWIERLQFNI